MPSQSDRYRANQLACCAMIWCYKDSLSLVASFILLLTTIHMPTSVCLWALHTLTGGDILNLFPRDILNQMSKSTVVLTCNIFMQSLLKYSNWICQFSICNLISIDYALNILWANMYIYILLYYYINVLY